MALFRAAGGRPRRQPGSVPVKDRASGLAAHCVFSCYNSQQEYAMPFTICGGPSSTVSNSAPVTPKTSQLTIANGAYNAVPSNDGAALLTGYTNGATNSGTLLSPGRIPLTRTLRHSYSWWQRTNNPSTVTHIVWAHGPGRPTTFEGNGGFAFLQGEASGRCFLEVAGNSGGGSDYWQYFFDVDTLDTWHHHVISIDRTLADPMVGYWENGQARTFTSSTNGGWVANNPCTDGPLWFGGIGADIQYNASVDFAYFNVFNVALSGDHALYLFRNPTAMIGVAGLIAGLPVSSAAGRASWFLVQ